MGNMHLSKHQIVSCYDEMARSGRFPDNTPVHQTFLELVSSCLNGSEPLDILDAGGGAGFFGLDFAALGHRVTLVDLSLPALRLARNRSQERKCSNRILTLAGDVEYLPLQAESFDIVVCMFVFSHLNDPGRALGELRRVLRKGGRIIVNFENKMWHVIAAGLCERYDEAVSLLTTKNPVVKAYDTLPPVRLYSVKDVEELCLSRGLKINSLTGVRHITIYQEPLKGIGTTETEHLLRADPKALALEELLMNSGQLLCMARFLLVDCEPAL
jgi:ubiquinone/menaquinone biosynthesis C-methylase UbiE